MSDKNIDLSVDLPGLVTIFGDALYEDFGSIVRELVQNAHDAIVEYCSGFHDGEERLKQHRIVVEFNKSERLLVVADNGKGMSEKEIIDNLNNFARSKKRSVEENIQDNSDNNAKELLHIVGEYGVGFLSAMAVSNDLNVWSKTLDNEITSWSYSTGKSNATSYAATQADLDDVKKKYSLDEFSSGTVVVCKLKEKIFEDYWLDENDLQKSISQFAGLLPIYVEYNREVISCKYLAWDNPMLANPDDWKDVISGMHDEEPLLVMPIYSPPDELDLQGVLWVPERTSYFSRPKLDIYVKRMYVLSDDEIVLPDWARFISGIINSNKLKRIVSGNTIKNDLIAKKCRNLIKDKIIDEFRKLRRRNEYEYTKIVGPHDDAIKGSASDSVEFRECVWDKLRFPSKDRKYTIPEYIQAVQRRTGEEDIYYCDEINQVHSANLVSEATGIPILNINQTRDDALVRKIASDSNYTIMSFRNLADKHFKTPEDMDNFGSLVDACANWNIDAEVREYNPSYLPAVIIDDKTFQDRRDQLLTGLKEHGEEYFAQSLERLFKKQNSANAGVSFYLNSSNDLINKLVESDPEDQKRTVLALYNISFMAAVPDLRDVEKRTIYESVSKALLGGVTGNVTKEESIQTKINELQVRDNNKPITIFMITPFSEEYKVVEGAVRKVFEAPPYYFRVLLARDYTYDSSLLKNINAHIDLSDAFVSEISDLNPNVMLELGAVLFSDRNKPIFSLRRSNSEQEVPADIKSEIYIEYTNLQSSCASIEDEIKSSIERNGRVSHNGISSLLEINAPKALSKTLLLSLAYKLSDQESDSLLKKYHTVEQFLSTQATNIAAEVDIKEYAIGALQEELKDVLKKS